MRGFSVVLLTTVCSGFLISSHAETSTEPTEEVLECSDALSAYADTFAMQPGASVSISKNLDLYITQSQTNEVLLVPRGGSAGERFAGTGNKVVPSLFPTKGNTRSPSAGWGSSSPSASGNFTRPPNFTLPPSVSALLAPINKALVNFSKPSLVAVSNDFPDKGSKMVVVDDRFAWMIDGETEMATIAMLQRKAISSVALGEGKYKSDWFFVMDGSATLWSLGVEQSLKDNRWKEQFAGSTVPPKRDMENSVGRHRQVASFWSIDAVAVNGALNMIFLAEQSRVLYIDEKDYVRQLPCAIFPDKVVAISFTESGLGMFVTTPTSLHYVPLGMGMNHLKGYRVNVRQEQPKGNRNYSQAFWTDGALTLNQNGKVSRCTLRNLPQAQSDVGDVAPELPGIPPVSGDGEDKAEQGGSGTVDTFPIAPLVGGVGAVLLLGAIVLVSKRDSFAGHVRRSKRSERSSNPRFSSQQLSTRGGSPIQSFQTGVVTPSIGRSRGTGGFRHLRKTDLSEMSFDDDDSAFDVPVNSRIPTRKETVRQLFDLI